MNWLISPSDFINCTTFLASFGWVSTSSQLIFLKAAFLLSSSHILFLFMVCTGHSINTCLADCIFCLYGHSGESNPGTFLKCKNFLRPIFSVLIYMIRALAALQRPLCSFNIFFVGFGQIACSFLPFFSLDQNSFHSLRVFWSIANLIAALVLPITCCSAVYPESYSLHFLFFLFALFYLVASLAATSASLFSLIFVWAGIQWGWIRMPLALRSSIHHMMFCMICGAEHLLGLSRACNDIWLSVKIWILEL